MKQDVAVVYTNDKNNREYLALVGDEASVFSAMALLTKQMSKQFNKPVVEVLKVLAQSCAVLEIINGMTEAMKDIARKKASNNEFKDFLEFLSYGNIDKELEKLIKEQQESEEK